MKKLYFTPEIETVTVDPCDIITASAEEPSSIRYNATKDDSGAYGVTASYESMFGNRDI